MRYSFGVERKVCGYFGFFWFIHLLICIREVLELRWQSVAFVPDVEEREEEPKRILKHISDVQSPVELAQNYARASIETPTSPHPRKELPEPASTARPASAILESQDHHSFVEGETSGIGNTNRSEAALITEVSYAVGIIPRIGEQEDEFDVAM